VAWDVCWPGVACGGRVAWDGRVACGL